MYIFLLGDLTGPNFPISYTRCYIKRNEGSSPEAANNPATIFMGSQEDFGYDAIGEMTFEDEAAYGRFIFTLQQPSVAVMYDDDLNMFLDRAKTKVVVMSDTVTSARR